ncbi:MAG TPA: hypothetical protein VEU47_18840 [Candidatus Cybelea sp.]|nr:hypothetical protein [Candidatus Cybelea sp.]
MKAFAVLSDYTNEGSIVFAKTGIEARKWGANELNDGELRGISCRRAPWADDLDGQVPARLMIAHGWHFECCGCGETIDEDWLYDNDLPIEGVLGTQHSRIYCSDICQARDNLDRAIKRDHERRAIEMLQAYVLKRFPSVSFAQKDNWKPHAYAVQRGGTWQVEQVAVSFEFPGMKIGPATCRLDRGGENARLIGPVKPYFMCCGGDREAFEAWASSPESRRPAP